MVLKAKSSQMMKRKLGRSSLCCASLPCSSAGCGPCARAIAGAVLPAAMPLPSSPINLRRSISILVVMLAGAADDLASVTVTLEHVPILGIVVACLLQICVAFWHSGDTTREEFHFKDCNDLFLGFHCPFPASSALCFKAAATCFVEL